MRLVALLTGACGNRLSFLVSTLHSSGKQIADCSRTARFFGIPMSIHLGGRGFCRLSVSSADAASFSQFSANRRQNSLSSSLTHRAAILLAPSACLRSSSPGFNWHLMAMGAGRQTYSAGARPAHRQFTSESAHRSAAHRERQSIASCELQCGRCNRSSRGREICS